MHNVIKTVHYLYSVVLNPVRKEGQGEGKEREREVRGYTTEEQVL